MPRGVRIPVASSRPMYVGDVPFVANSTQTLPTKGGNLPRTHFLKGLHLEIEGRLAVAGANADAELADSPYSLIDEISIEGYHRPRQKREKFYQLRGAEIRQLAMLFGQRAPGSTGALGVATGNKDFRFQLPIIFPPERISRREQSGFLLDAPNYDDLVFSVKWGNGTSVLNPAGATTYAFTAFGSGAGSPTMRVVALQSIFGRGFDPKRFIPGQVWRYYKEVSGSPLTTTATDQRLFDLMLGSWIREVLVKTGVKDTEVVAGCNAYASLSNAILNQIRVVNGVSSFIRHFPTFTQFREYAAARYGITPDAGYAAVDFVDEGEVSEAFPTQGLAREGVEMYVQADVTGAANQAALFAVQEIRGEPQIL